jgi:hypothetical protein
VQPGFRGPKERYGEQVILDELVNNDIINESLEPLKTVQFVPEEKGDAHG